MECIETRSPTEGGVDDDRDDPLLLARDYRPAIGSRESFTWIILKTVLCLSWASKEMFYCNKKLEVAKPCHECCEGLTLTQIRASYIKNLEQRFVDDKSKKNAF